MPNKIIDLRPLCPPVVDQGDLATDSASAFCSALEMIEIKAPLQGLYPTSTSPRVAGRPNVRLSRLFLYYNQRDIENTLESDNGAKIASGLRSLEKQGCCTEDSWKYNVLNFATRPSDACYMEGLLHKITSSQHIETLDQMRASLADGFPFVFSMTIYESFQNPRVEKTGFVTMPGPGEQYFGSMAVLAVGYDDSKKILIVRNSFGPSWGQAGYFTLPYDYVTSRDLCADFWTMRL